MQSQGRRELVLMLHVDVLGVLSGWLYYRGVQQKQLAKVVGSYIKKKLSVC